MPVDLHTPEDELRRLAGQLLEERAARSAAWTRRASWPPRWRLPLPADEQSIVGRLPGAEWLYVAVTHSGVTLAAHLSRLIAADLEPGAPSRRC